MMRTFSFSRLVVGPVLGAAALAAFSLHAGDRPAVAGWQPLFNGVNLDGWSIHLGDQPRNADPAHLVQVRDGVLHFYAGAADGSKQPFGYVATDREYTSFRLRLEYRWGTNRFAPRAGVKRDSGLIYLVHGADKVWPDGVEFQVQEGDVGDIYTISTQVTAPVAAESTNVVTRYLTNETSGVVKTNLSVHPRFRAAARGGVPFVQGKVGTSLRFIREPEHEHAGWNTIELVVRDGRATHLVNGQVNNDCLHAERQVGNQWVPLKRGRLALQLEGAEVFYRNIEIQELPE